MVILNKKIWYLILGVLVSFLVVSLVKVVNENYKYVSFQEVYSQKNKLEAEEMKLENLVQKKAALSEEMETMKESVEDKNPEEVIRDLENKIDLYKGYSGLTDVSGEGVIVIMNDSQIKVNNRSVSSLLVHDYDIIYLINDLKAAGAEAISINNERIITGKSRIECAGPTILINDKLIAQPFIIRAIGDRFFLESAINSPNGYGSVLREWDIFLEVNTSVNVNIPKYNGRLEYDYLKGDN